MNPTSERLERLFSREIDGECTPDEARLLAALLDEHPDVQAAFDDYRRLDAAVGAAMRAALGRPVDSAGAVAARGSDRPAAAAADSALRARFGMRFAPRPGVIAKIGRTAAVAAAACIGLLIWLHPSRPAAESNGPRQAGSAAAPAFSWFAPPAEPADTVEPAPRDFERPEVQVRGVQRDWLIVPGDKPGTYMVIEVDHVRTRAIGMHQDS